MNKFVKLLLLPSALFTIATSSQSCAVSPKEIALITDVGDIDDGGFNQESWLAIKNYGIKHHKTYDFYRPFNDTVFARTCAIKQAVAKGAKFVVLPGFKFATTAIEASDLFPDVHFLVIDTYLHHGDYVPVTPNDNVCCVGYKCEYSGYLAGYAVTQDLFNRDYRELNGILRDTYGFAFSGGMALDGCFEFGFGYVQGICCGASKFCDDKAIYGDSCPMININYDYAGVYGQDDQTTMKLKSLFAKPDRDIKACFACGGKLYQSITEATQYHDKHNLSNYDDWVNGKLKNSPREAVRWIGVDSDQSLAFSDKSFEKAAIYTSALKGLDPAITDALDCHFEQKDYKWSDIGGPNHSNSVDGCFNTSTYQWILGLHTVFGDISGLPVGDDYNDYVGIPVPLDADGNRILSNNPLVGFDNFSSNDYDSLRADLISKSKGAVYGENGKNFGSPDAWLRYPSYIKDNKQCPMDEWTREDSVSNTTIYFKERYLGDYANDTKHGGTDHDRIDIKIGY